VAAGQAARSETNTQGGDIHLTHAPHIENRDPDLESVLQRQGRAMRNWVKAEVRDNPDLFLGGRAMG
jgi:hypothetical protein